MGSIAADQKIPTPPMAAERETGGMAKDTVLYVRSAVDDKSGANSRKAQVRAGREYARKNGLRITRIIESKGKAPLDGRRDLRGFVDYVKSSPSLQALLMERPERLSRHFRDWVDLHEFCRKNDRELRFFGTGQSPESDKMMLEMALALYRRSCEARRGAKKRGSESC